MSILTLELVIFACSLFILVKLRKPQGYVISVTEGLTVYCTPTDKDFEVLEKTNAKPKTNMKGEPRKNEKHKAKTKAQFPMRTIEVSKELLSYVQEFYETLDFIILMFLAAVLLFVTVAVLVLVEYEPVNKMMKINITFYVVLFLLAAILSSLVRDSFNLGWFKLAN